MVATVAGSVGVAVAALLPWATTGRVTRTGLSLAGTIHRLGAGPGTVLRTALVLFAFTPALAAVTWAAAFWGRTAAVATLGGLTGLVAELGWMSARRSSLGMRYGAHLAMVAGGIALAGAAALACQLAALKWQRRGA